MAKQRDLWREALDHLSLGSPLNCDRFKETWAEWCEHRKHKRAAMTPETVKRQIRRLDGWGLDRAIAALENSMEQGYQGIFEPTGKAGSNGHGKGVGRIPSSEANKLRDSKLVEKCRAENVRIRELLANRRAGMQAPNADGDSKVG